MIKLNGKQKRQLRSVGQSLSPEVLLGKAGMTDGIVARIQTCLEGCELIKIRLPAGTPDRTELAHQLAHSVQADCVGVIGRSVLLYRPNLDLDDDLREWLT